MKKNKNILVFYPYNKIAIDQISVIELISKKHKIIFLSIDNEGPLHKIIKNMNITTYSIKDDLRNKNFFFNSKYFLYMRMMIFFRKIVLKHKINIVFSHLEIPALISGFFSFFYSYSNFYFRHNIDSMNLDSNFKGRIANRLANFFSKNIVCVSEPVREYLINFEKVKSSKVRVIENGYDFKKYTDYKYQNNVIEIKKKYKAEILLVCIGRLVPLKRHIMILKLISKLNLNFKNKFKLLILGNGPEIKRLLNYSNKHNLNNVYFLGYKENIIDYIKASNLLLHFSQSESFGHVVIEAGLSSVPALACKNTGIFEKIIDHNKSGFLVKKNDPINDSYLLLSKVTRNKLNLMGKQLNINVLEKFHIKKTIDKYFNLIDGQK